jgi:hypothetical protein
MLLLEGLQCGGLATGKAAELLALHFEAGTPASTRFASCEKTTHTCSIMTTALLGSSRLQMNLAQCFAAAAQPWLLFVLQPCCWTLFHLVAAKQFIAQSTGSTSLSASAKALLLHPTPCSLTLRYHAVLLSN